MFKEQTKRNLQIYLLRKKNPWIWSYEKIGRRYNISKQRVYDIVKIMEKKHGSETDPELNDSLVLEQK